MAGESLAAVAQRLRGEAQQGGTVTLDASLVGTDLARVIGSPTVVIEGVDYTTIPTSPGTSFTFDGTMPATGTPLGLPARPAHVMVTTNAAGAVVFVLRIDAGKTWTIGDTYDGLAGQSADALVYDLVAFYLSTAPDATPVKAPDPAVTVPVATGLSIWARAAIEGPFAPLEFVSSAKSLDLYGAVTAGTSWEDPSFDLTTDLDLTLPIVGGPSPVPGIAGVTVDHAVDEDGRPYVVPRVYVGVTHTVGTVPLELTSSLSPSSDTVELMLRTVPQGTTSPASLTTLFGGADGVGGLLSACGNDDLTRLLDSISFLGVSALLSVGATAVDVAMLTLDLGTAGPEAEWKPFDGVCVTFFLSFTMYGPLKTPQFTGMLDATVCVEKTGGGTYDFTAVVELPDLVFSGAYEGTVTVTLAELVRDLVGDALTIPEHLAYVSVESMMFDADVKASTYDVTVVLDAGLTLFGTDVLRLEETAVTLTADTSKTPKAFTASVAGLVVFEDLEVAVSAAFGTGEDTVFTLQLVGETVGSLLGRLVHLVDPTADLDFPAPWDTLLDVSLDSLALTVDVTNGSVAASFDVGLHLGFAEVDSVRLAYQKDPSAPSRVDVEVTGSFLGKSYGSGSPPLTWDAAREQPPAVSGSSSVLDLRYLGLGQHLTVQGFANDTTMAAVTDAMEKSLIPDLATGLPDFTKGLVFAEHSGWLAGADLTLMGTVTLQVVFNDPALYGLHLALYGDKAGPMAGLDLEILYRKVSPSVGLYHVTFTLPDSMRHLELGEVSVTLPVLVLDVYTNGEFRVDLGFPVGLDFSNSFSVQMFPFVGYGGFYVAKLDGTTSSRVPAIGNGTFAPVIEFGLALSLGVGKTMDAGILKAGISVTVIGVLEGVIGWFNPTTPGVASDRYYRVQGTIAIVGNLYGSVNFGIVSADVSVTVYASATLVVEAYQPILVGLDAGVSVSVSLKVVFFTIHFSFSTTVHASFTIGSVSTPPWQPAVPGTSSPRPVTRMMRALAPRAVAGDEPFAWTPVPSAFGDDRPVLDIAAVPVVTVAGDAGATALLLFLENCVDPAAATPDEVRVTDGGQAAWDLFARAVLNWVVTAWSRTHESWDGTVPATALRTMLDTLAATGDSVAFTAQNIDAFFQANFGVVVTPRSTDPDAPQTSATVFPMLPDLAMTAGGTTTDFATQPYVVDGTYAPKLEAYVAALRAGYLANVAPEDDDDEQLVAAAPGSATESLATAVCRAYFSLVARAAIREAAELLAAYPATPGAQSLNDLARSYGSQAVAIVTANHDATVLTPQTVPLSGVVHQVRAAETLTSLAAAYGVGAADLAAAVVAPGLLPAGSPFTVNASNVAAPLAYTTSQGDASFAFVASFLLVRRDPVRALAALSGVPQLAAAIAKASGIAVDVGAPLAPGTALRIPDATAGTFTDYATRRGDTVTLVAAYVANAAQDVVPTAELTVHLAAANAGKDPSVPGSVLTLPEIDLTVRPGETLASIADTLLVSPDALVAGSTIGAVPLATGVAIPVPEFGAEVTADDSFDSLAQRYGMTLYGLAEALGDVTGLFAGTVTVPDVASLTFMDIVDGLVANGSFNALAAMTSRFLLHGLQVPVPDDPYWLSLTAETLAADPRTAAPVVTAPLYALTGQQVPTPADGELTLTNPRATSWLTPGSGEACVVALTATETALSEALPSTALDSTAMTLTRLPLYQVVPPAYGLAHEIVWQAASPPPLGGTVPATGALPSIWPFPDALVAALRDPARDPNERHELCTAASHDVSGVSPVARYAWATLVEVGIRRLPPTGDGVTTAYVLTGPDHVGQDVLDALVADVEGDATVHLLYRPSPGSSGYASDVVGTAFLAKTNLSHGAVPTSQGPPVPVPLAPIVDARAFLTYVWECGVTGGGPGFYLAYETEGGAALPDNAFDGDTATVALLVLPGTIHADPATSAVPAYANCAVVGDAVDATTSHVLVRPVVATVGATDTLGTLATAYGAAHGVTLTAGDLAVANAGVPSLLAPGTSLALPDGGTHVVEYGDTFASVANDVRALGDANATTAVLRPGAFIAFAPGALTQHAAVAAGNTGFSLVRPDATMPDVTTGDVDATQYAAQLFQLVEFALRAGGGFEAGGQGPAAGPADDGPVAPGAPWTYRRLLAIAPFAERPSLPEPDPALGTGLPARWTSPYAGIAPGAAASLRLALRDVLGNARTTNPPLPDPFTIPVGYVDDLLGVGRWPGSAWTYAFAPGTAPAATLTLSQTFKAGPFEPGTGDPAPAIRAARAASVRYRQVFEQLTGPGVHARWRTSVDSASAAGGDAYALDVAPLAQLAAHAYLHLATLGALRGVTLTTTGGTTLAQVADAAGVPAKALLAANGTVPAEALFAQGMTVRVVHAARPQDTLTTIAAADAQHPATVLEVVTANAAVPLAAGVAVPLPHATTWHATAGASFAGAVATTHGSLAGIVAANSPTKGLLAAGVELAVPSAGDTPVSYTVAAGDALDDVVTYLRANGLPTVTALQVAQANETTAGVFAEDAAVSVPDVVTGAKDTLAGLAAGDLGALATAAADVPGLFAPGTLLRVTTATYQGPSPLAEVATAADVSLADLAEDNAATAVAGGVVLAVPGAAAFGTPVGSPHRVASGETFATIAALYPGATAGDLWTLTQDVPGVLTTGVTLTAGTASVTTTAGETPGDVYLALRTQDASVTVEQAAEAVGPGDLVTGALVAAPPLRVPAGATFASVSPANYAVRGLLAPGTALTMAAGGKTWTRTVADGDTVATLALLASDTLGETVTPAALAAAHDLPLVEGAYAVPAPPPPVSYAVPVTPSNPSAMFPLDVVLEISRDANLVDPDFATAPAVAVAATPLAPAGGDDPGALAAFATAFEASFAGLRLATGTALTEEDTRSPLWAVRIGAADSPIRYATDPAKVGFYALRPLSRTPWGGSAGVPAYTSGEPLGATTSATFGGIDLDVWATTFLHAVDLVLSPSYAVPAASVNPDALALLVGIKQRLAAAIATGLASVVDVPPPDGALAAAAAMLEQSLLEALAPAYGADTLVQLPVDVTASPFTDPAVAPRLSGTVTATTYKTPATEPATFATVAAALGVSAAYVAETLAYAHGILVAGQTVTYAGTSYVVTSADTLVSVADHLGVDPITLLPGIGLADPARGLFAPGTALGVSPLTRVVAAGDTLGRVADLFDCSVADVGLANDAVPGLLPPKTYTIGTTSVVVGAGDTLADIAAKAGPTVQKVAEALASAPLAAGVTVRGLQYGKAYGLSTASVALAATTPPPWLTFLVSVQSPATTRSLTLDLDYVVNALECPLGPPDSETGYQASDWLTFVLPFDGAGGAARSTIGQVEIPVPLRAYPSVPMLVEQSGAFTKEPAAVADLRGWTYAMTFQHVSAAQDTIGLSLVLDQAPPGELYGLADAPPTLAEALAAFVSVYPAIQQDLSLLPRIPLGTPSPYAAAALDAFVLLAGKVAAAWATWWPETSGAAAGAPATATYRMEPVEDSDRDLAEVVLTGGSPWPNLAVLVGDDWHALTPRSTGDAEVRYTLDDGTHLPIADASQWRLAWDLDVVKAQNAWTSVSVTRNDDLLLGTALATNPAFVYDTGPIGFANVLVPLLSTTDPLAFGTAGEVEPSLAALFTALLGDDGGNGTPSATVACAFGYPVVPDLPDMLTVVPVTLSPASEPIAPEALAERLAAAFAWWSTEAYGAPVPPVAGGLCLLDVSVFSSVDPARTLPLLRATNLQLRLTGV